MQRRVSHLQVKQPSRLRVILGLSLSAMEVDASSRVFIEEYSCQWTVSEFVEGMSDGKTNDQSIAFLYSANPALTMAAEDLEENNAEALQHCFGSRNVIERHVGLCLSRSLIASERLHRPAEFTLSCSDDSRNLSDGAPEPRQVIQANLCRFVA